MKKAILSFVISGCLLTNMSFAEFSDVATTHWAYPAINKMQEAGILSGYVDGTFNPNKNISLAEFASIFTKIFELPLNTTDNYFIEIPFTHWAKTQIETVRKYINPYYDSLGESLGFNQYSYMDGITGDLEMSREAFVYAVSKIYGYNEADYIDGEEKVLFADADEILFPKETVLAYKNGVINGEIVDGKTYIRPTRNITRAEASAIFRNLLKYEETRVKNVSEEVELEKAFETIISKLKETDFDGLKNSIYDTSGVLNNEYFTISEENLNMLKEVSTKYFKNFKYEVVESGFDGFNNGYVKVKIKGYDIKNELNGVFDEVYLGFEEKNIGTSMSEFLANFLESIKKKTTKVCENEEVFNFVKQNGEWKLWIK